MGYYTSGIVGIVVKIGISVGLFLALFIMGEILKCKVLPFVAKKVKLQWVKTIVESTYKPAFVLCTCIGAYLFVVTLISGFGISAILFVSFMSKLLNIAIVVCVTWVLVNCASLTSLLIGSMSKKIDKSADETLTNFFTRIVRGLLIAIAVVIVIEIFGYDISVLVTGLGLGGLTFALAAQDSASNFFGGLVLITERPFSVGDWIKCGEHEGIVEDITFRSTLIRTFADTLITVPNSIISAGAINNMTSMSKRRAEITLTTTYSTTKEQLQELTNGIKDILNTHSDVILGDYQVRLSEFADSSINVWVLFFTIPTDVKGYFDAKEMVNYEIMELMDKLNISFAYPTSSVYLENYNK